MTLWHFNPSEPCANQTEPRLNGDATDNAARKCGDCPMVPEMWRLEIPAVDVSENPLFNGYQQSVFYLTRDPWRRSDGAANNCGWTDGTFGPTNSDVTFRLSYEITAFPGFANEAGWLLLDYRHKGNTPRNVWFLRNVRNCLTLLEGQPFERPAPFRCCCANRFEDISDVYEPRRFATVTPYNGICPAPDVPPVVITPTTIAPDPVELELTIPDPTVSVYSPPIDYCGCSGTQPTDMFITRISDSFVVANLVWDGISAWVGMGNTGFESSYFQVYCNGGNYELDDGTGTYSNSGPKSCSGNSMAEFVGTVAGGVYFGDTPSGS